jgi:hypothetical protein
MAELTKIQTNAGTFRVVVNQIKGNSNYSKCVSVFHNADKRPLFGTVFNDNTNPTELIEWANKNIKPYVAKFDNVKR